MFYVLLVLIGALGGSLVLGIVIAALVATWDLLCGDDILRCLGDYHHTDMNNMGDRKRDA